MNESLASIASRLNLTYEVFLGVIGVAAFLLIGSLVRLVAVRNLEPAQRFDRLGSLLVWWGGLALVVLVASGGARSAALIFGLISLIGLREYFRLLDHLTPDRTGRLALFALLPLVYLAAWWNDDLWFSLIMPAASLLVVAASQILAGKTTGYLASVGALLWGWLVIVFFPAHCVRLIAVPPASNPVGGAAGWFVYLIVLTECDDIFQALWGRRFGKRKITPRISPNKSLEGLLGGIVSTLLIGIVLAPWLTPLARPWDCPWFGAIVRIPYAGVVVACAIVTLLGFLGDLNMSALKRDAGVKDTGRILPGQGGILDRVDSLTFTAPAFYYFVRWLER